MDPAWFEKTTAQELRRVEWLVAIGKNAEPKFLALPSRRVHEFSTNTPGLDPRRKRIEFDK
jgi:hypothetical protein